MASRIRILLAIFLGLLLVGLLGLGRWTLYRAKPDPPAVASRDCVVCHADVCDEWRESFHSRAFSDPNVQAAFQHFGFDRKCQTCHAPRPLFVTGLAEEVQLREDDRQSGVNCLSCHQTPDGEGVAARRTIADAPCRPVRQSELTTSGICGKCHDAIHDDWQASHWVDKNKTCQDCHMPPVAGRDGGRSHLCLGGHHEATVRSGAKMSCRQQGDQLVVSVANHATGHNFPGERHNRMLLLQVIERGKNGRITLSAQKLIKGVTPFRGETSAEEVRAGNTFEARFPIVEPPVVADVRRTERELT